MLGRRKSELSCEKTRRGPSLSKLLPLFTVLGYLWASFSTATRVRLLGMGDLSLVVEDESDLINLYDFGGNVAGLWADQDRSTFEAGISYSTREASDTGGVLEPEVSIVGTPFPCPIVELLKPLPYPFLVLEETTAPRLPSGGSLVYRTSNMAVEGRGSFSRSISDSMGYQRSTNTPSGSLRLNYLLGERLSVGILGDYIWAEQTDSQGELESRVSDLHSGVGVAVNLGAETVLGGKVFHDRVGIEKDFLECHTNISFRGNSLGGGLQGIIRQPKGLRAGMDLSYKRWTAEGRRSTAEGTAATGDLEQVDYLARMRLLTTAGLLPIQLGLAAGYGSTAVAFEPTSEYGSDWRSDRTYTEIPVAIGAAYAIPGLLLGAEFHYLAGREKDNEGDSVVTSRRARGNLGVELSPLEAVSLRMGWQITNWEHYLTSEEDGSPGHRLTGGFGFVLPGSVLKGDLAYHYVLPRDVSGGDSKASESLLSLAFEFCF